MIKSFAITYNIGYKMDIEFNGELYIIIYDLIKKEE
jgi:hypothetical protein